MKDVQILGKAYFRYLILIAVLEERGKVRSASL